MAEESRVRIILEAETSQAEARIGKATKGFIDALQKTGLVAKKTGRVLYDQYGKVLVRLDKTTVATKKTTAATNQYSRASKEMRLVTGSLQRQIGILRNQLLLVAFAYHTVQRFVLGNIKVFAEFQKQLTNISVMMEGNVGPVMIKFRNLIEDLSITWGVAAEQLTKSMFDIYSATGKTAVSMDILRAATKLAVAGGSTLASTTSGLVTIIEAYGKRLKGAADAADLLFATQVKARATIGELAAEVGKFLPLAAKLNITEEEALAVFAKITVGLGDVSEAATAMRGILNALLKPTRAMEKATKIWFGTSVQQAAAEKGLIAILEKLRDIDAARLGQMVRRVRALTGVTIATSDLAKVQKDAIYFQERAGIVAEALDRQMATTEKSLDVLKETWHKANRAIGEFIAQGTPAIRLLSALAGGQKEWLRFLKQQRPEIVQLIKAQELHKKALEETGGLGVKVTSEFSRYLNLLREEGKILEYTLDGIILTGEERLKINEEFRRRTEERINEELELERTAMREMRAERAVYAAQIAEDWEKYLGTLQTRLVDVMIQTGKGMQRAFSDLFFDFMTGELDNLEDYFRQWGRVILRELSNVIAKMIVVKTLGGFGWFGGGAATTTTPAPTLTTLHKGGMVRRYQEGGVVPALLEPGEGVVSQKGMQSLGVEDLNKLNRGERISGSGGGVTIVIAQTIQAWDTSDVMRNIKTITAGLADEITRNARIRGVLREYG